MININRSLVFGLHILYPTNLYFIIWRTKMVRVISLITVCLINLIFSATAYSEVKIGPPRLLLTTQDWGPYQTFEAGEMGGAALDKVKCVLNKMRQPYQLTMTSWSEAQLRVHTGGQHGFFVATQTKERDSYATLSSPISEQKLTWYFGPGVEPNVNELSKLNLMFSAKFGSSKWFWLKRNGYNVVKQPRDAKVLLRLLKQREIDIALEDQDVFEQELKQAGLPIDFFQNKLLRIEPMGVYFSNRFLKKYTGFLNKFNANIANCEG